RASVASEPARSISADRLRPAATRATRGAAAAGDSARGGKPLALAHRRAAQELGGREPLAAGALELAHLQRTGATSDEDAVIASFEHGAGRAAARAAARLPDLQRLSLPDGARSRCGPESAQLALDFRAARRPVDFFVFLAELARVGRARLRLRRR